eukprot:g22459.t1
MNILESLRCQNAKVTGSLLQPRAAAELLGALGPMAWWAKRFFHLERSSLGRPRGTARCRRSSTSGWVSQRRDGPNGPGCMQMGDECVAGFWRDGKRERWLEDIPADPISNAARVFTDVREDSVASPRRKNDGVMLAMLPSGDAYAMG